MTVEVKLTMSSVIYPTTAAPAANTCGLRNRNKRNASSTEKEEEKKKKKKKKEKETKIAVLRQTGSPTPQQRLAKKETTINPKLQVLLALYGIRWLVGYMHQSAVPSGAVYQMTDPFNTWKMLRTRETAQLLCLVAGQV